MIEAEEPGITQTNVEQRLSDPDQTAQRALGLDERRLYNVIRAATTRRTTDGVIRSACRLRSRASPAIVVRVAVRAEPLRQHHRAPEVIRGEHDHGAARSSARPE